MRYITIIIVILAWWVMLGIGLNYLAQDDLLKGYSIDGSTNYSYSSNNINMSNFAVENTDDSGLWDKVKSGFQFLFLLKNPLPSGVPSILTLILNIINWFLFIMLCISVYRIGNPISGG